jgi:ribosome biogenesis protein MAK21
MNRIKPDEVFFHRYFVAKEEREVKALGKRKHGKEGEEELDEDEIWEALVKSSKVEGGLEDIDVDGLDGESVQWSDDDSVDGEMVEEMNAGISESNDMSDEEMEDIDDMSDNEGDIDAFFDGETEEIENEDEDEDEEIEEVSDVENKGSRDSDGSADVDGPFELGDPLSDLMDSDEEVAVPVQQTNADRSKKRKLKNLPTFASAEEYAHMLVD